MILWSCNNSAEKPAMQEEKAVPMETQHEESAEAIELNNGEKWEVNAEMKPFILKGEDLVNTYIKNGDTDYKNLAEQLKQLNGQLIESCTMEGKSHDELHKWLHPHLGIVETLEAETDASRANEIVSRLQKSYEEFHLYFK